MSTRKDRDNCSNVAFLDAIGRVLARGTVPADGLIEGEHNSVKEFKVIADVIQAGKLDHYVTTSAKNETIKGPIVQEPENGPGCFVIDRVDVKAGERITATMRALTVKEGAA